MKKFLFTLFALHVLLNASAQKEKRIETDRPNESELADLVPKKYFQIESGIYSEKISPSDFVVIHPHTLLRYGVSERIELRLLSNFSTFKEDNNFSTKTSTGLEPVELGFKFSLLEERKAIPATSLLFQTGIPFLASKNFKAVHLSPKIRLLMENRITDNIELTYNAGAEWDGLNKEATWIYSFSPGIDIGRRWNAFVEVFGKLNKSEAAQHTIDGGIEYFVTKDFDLDICSGFGLNKTAPDFFITIGGSVRFR